MNKQPVVRLTPEQRRHVQELLRRDGATALEQRRARILLHADVGQAGPRLTDRDVAAAALVDPRTVARVRAQFTCQGLETALARRPRRATTPRKLDGAQEARLITLACSTPPEGRARWSLRLLSQRAVELEVVDAISHETVRRTLKKTSSSPG